MLILLLATMVAAGIGSRDGSGVDGHPLARQKYRGVLRQEPQDRSVSGGHLKLLLTDGEPVLKPGLPSLEPVPAYVVVEPLEVDPEPGQEWGFMDREHEA